MKLLTKEEEEAHYNATIKGGLIGGVGGLALGVAGVYGATMRYPAFRSLTLPLKAFLVTSSGTFAAIVYADRASRAFENARNADNQYRDKSQRARAEAEATKPVSEQVTDWLREHRYPIVGGSWVASMAAALAIVGRSPHMSTQQKLVQARVYAQGLTLAVLMATAAFELSDSKKGEGRWETVKVIDPNDPEHKHLIEKRVHKERYAGEDLWRDMVENEERKLKERDEAVHKQEEEDRKKGKGKKNHQQHPDKKDSDHKGDDDGEKKGGAKPLVP